MEHFTEIYHMIQELAAFEKLEKQVRITPQRLMEDFQRALFRALIVVNTANNSVVAFCLYYISYSTWEGPFMHVEDVYVRVDHRRQGLGNAMFKRLARIATDQNMSRIQWNVLEWNNAAIDFYNKLGAFNLTTAEGWQMFRWPKDRFQAVAAASLPAND